MLTAIRNKSKGWVAYVVVGLIVVPFALFGINDYVSSSSRTSIATVNGENVDINIYYQELNTQQRNLQQQLGAAYSQEIDTALKQTLIDSMMCGTPSISFNVGGMQSHIIDGFNGYKAPEYNSESLVSSINLFLNNIALVGPSKITEHALNLYSKKKHSSEMVKIYTELYP